MSFQINTERVYLREMSESDGENIFLLNSNPNVLLYTGDQPFEDIESAENFIKSYDQYKLYGIGRWSAYLKESDKYIGWCGLKYHENEDYVDLGFRLVEEEWNKGYATECGRACLKYAFEYKNYTTIVSRTDARNIASMRVIQKIGFQYQKEINENGYQWLIFSIKKRDFINLDF